MTDGSNQDLTRRLDRIERFLARQGFDPSAVDRSMVAEDEAAEARPPAMPPPLPIATPITIVPGGVPNGMPDGRGVPIAAAHAAPYELDSNRVASGAAPPIAGIVDRDDPSYQDGPQPRLSVAAPLEPHVPDDRGYPVPASSIADRPDKATQFAAMRAGHAGAAPPPMPGAPRSGGLEQLVGLNLAGWVGAIVFVIGAALGVKFAYDQGWLGGVPDSVRLGLLYALGFGVVGLGEWVYRRVGALASAGVFGAGVAILFVVGYAGDAYFNLYGQRAAFALMAGASVVGAIVAWRAQLASIAVLSLLGANLAPALLGRSSAGETTLLVYLLALQLLALVLAHIGRGERWWALRGVVLATTAIWVIVRLAQPGTARSTPMIAFTLLYAALFHLEAALAAWRAGRATGPASDGESAQAMPPPLPRTRLHGTFAAFTASVTTLLTLAVLVWTDAWPRPQAGATLLGMAMLAITAGGAAIARGHAAGRAWRELALSWLGQGMTLVVVAVPVALNGPAVIVAFAALALLYGAIGAYTRRPGPAVAGAIVWALAVLTLTAMSFEASPVFTIGGVAITRGLLLGVALAGVGHALALLLGSSRYDRATSGRTGMLARGLGAAMPVFATIVAVVACLASLPALPATVAIALVAWATAGVAALGGGLERPGDPEARRGGSVSGALAMLAVGVAALASLKWLCVDALSLRLGGGDDATPTRAIFNATMAVGVGVAAALVALVLATARRRGMVDERPRQIERLVTIGLAVGVVAIGLAAELDVAARASVAASDAPRWNAAQLTCLAHSTLALVLAIAAWPVARMVAPLAAAGSRLGTVVGVAIVLIAAKFALVDTLAFAADDRVLLPTPLLNFQAILAAGVTLACVLAARRTTGGVATAATAMAAVVPLVAGSVEVARAVGPGRTLVALSIFWAAYAATAIAVGFAVRGGLALRVGGLALLAITIGKVVLVDLASAGTGWRILSFLAVGVLLLATSVLYGKFGAKLMRRDEDEAGRGFTVDGVR